MSVSRVRAQVNGTWYTLSYNSSTGKYETTITPGTVSSGQSGGYFNATVEGVISTGASATVSGSTMAGLRLVVQDKTKPSLTVSAPANGLVTAAASVTVSGTVTDNVGVTSLTINGTSAAVGSGGAFSKSVSLSAGSNTITVVAKDAAGNTSTITRTVTRAAAGPSLGITSPSDGTVTAAGTITVTGTVSDAVSPVSSVTVNSVAASVSGETFSATVPLSEGANTLTVTAKNQVGLSTVKSVSVTRDSTAPVIALTAPAAGQMVSNASFSVTGTVRDSGSGLRSVTVNGAAASVSGGTFTAVVRLSEGVNAITAIAEDHAGNTASAKGSVLLDTIPPALAVDMPTAGLITNRPALTVSGTASDGGSGLQSVSVNGAAAEVSGGAYSVSLTLKEGENTITVTAVDQVGNSATVSRSVLLDTREPVLTLVSPPEGWITTNRPNVVFAASDEDGGSGLNLSSVEVAVDGKAQTAAVSGGTIVYTPDVPLSEGRHVITVTVRDRAGNLRGLSVVYGVDTVPPELMLMEPNNHRVVDDETVFVAGTVFDAASPPCMVWIAADGVSLGEAVAAEDGAFSRTVPLEVGVNEIVITARDGAGLTTIQTVRMIRLVTDRTQTDADRVLDLCRRGYDLWTAAERNWWAHTPCRRGSYDALDLNRVTAAMDWIAGWMEDYGYETAYHPEDHRPWTDTDAMTVPQGRRYLDNVEALRKVFPLSWDTPETPGGMDALTIQAANDIERILVAVDAVRAQMDESVFYSGEIDCGEV